jgi:hypothetical protein
MVANLFCPPGVVGTQEYVSKINIAHVTCVTRGLD